MDVLLERPPWFLVGPLLGLTVVAVFAMLNERLAVLGGYSELLERAVGSRPALGWKAWFLVGIVGGGLLFGLLAASWRVDVGYGWLEHELGSNLAIGAMLAGGGVLIGLGAKAAGGCTSGHGLSGCSFGSPASFVATGTFMATAVGTAFAWTWLLG